jgi:hypothetical protein
MMQNTEDIMIDNAPYWKWGVLIVIIAALQVADVLTTQECLRLGGYEQNPFMVLVVEDIAAFWGVKIAVVATSCLPPLIYRVLFRVATPAEARLLQFGRGGVSALLVAVMLWYMGVIGNNLWHLWLLGAF